MLEVKGYVDERALATKAAADRWVDAVNQDGRYGKWDYRVCSDPVDVEDIIRMSVQHLVKVGKNGHAKHAARAGVAA